MKQNQDFETVETMHDMLQAYIRQFMMTDVLLLTVQVLVISMLSISLLRNDITDISFGDVLDIFLIGMNIFFSLSGCRRLYRVYKKGKEEQRLYEIYCEENTIEEMEGE